MIQNDILKNIKNPKIKKNQIKYIISVPISWKEFEKQIIINAAYESGMNNIRLIYDNEAASLSMMNDRYIESKYKSDHKIFLSIDAGGYYTNITINEITNSTIKEKIKIKNNIYKNIGILTISEEIIKILEQIFGKNYIDYLKRENPGEWVKTLKDIYSAIESTYCIDGIELFEINSKFNSKGKYEYSYQTEKGINKYIIEYNEYIVTLPAGLVGNIIYKNVRYIMNIIDNIIDEMKLKRININSILVSGGLSKNKIFQNEIENNLKIKIPINYLTSYENAISKGAVFYGIDSDKIKSRISKETIGIRVKENNNNKIKVLIKKGEEIENYSLNIFIKPSLKNQERIQINVYATDNEELSENDFLGRLLLYLNKNNNGIIQLTIKYDIVLNFYAVDYEKEEEIKFDFELFK
jgi:molecular chaperone DnaK (HSP70)